MKERALALLILASAGGCGGASQAPATPGYDTPIPPGEPRATMRLRVDLAPAQDCEELFDLTLYKNRGIDLVQWDDARGACAGRVIQIHYLPRRLSADEVTAAVRALAKKVDKDAEK